MTGDKDEELRVRIIAEMQVDAFLSLLETRYGIKSEDIPQFLDDMRWVRQHRVGMSRVSWAVLLGVAAIAVSGLVHALWDGIKASITK